MDRSRIDTLPRRHKGQQEKQCCSFELLGQGNYQESTDHFKVFLISVIPSKKYPQRATKRQISQVVPDLLIRKSDLVSFIKF